MEKVSSSEKTRTITLYYDGDGYYAYVLMRSSDKQVPISSEEVEIVKNVLQENGVSPIHIGKSFRPASNGQQYDWYIRVTEKGIKPSSETISAIFESLSKSTDEEETSEEVTSQEVEDYIKQLVENIEKERQGKSQITLDLQNATKEIKALESDKNLLLHEKSEISQKLQRLEEIIQNNSKEHSFYEDYQKELLKDNASYKSKVENFSAEYKRLNVEIGNLEAQRKYYEDESKRLEKEYKKLRSVLSKDKTTTLDIDNEFDKLLNCLLPEVIFEKGSIDLLKNEIRYELALQKIKKILNGETKPDDTIKRKGYSTWYEYHFGSGQGHNNGRIYSIKGKDGKYRVLIGLKETQDEDIKGLIDIPLQ